MKRESSERRQAQIKKAVLDIISEEGLHSISTRNLARRVGLTDGAIFRHFKSKLDIIKSIMDDVETGLISELRAIVRSSDKAEDRLYKFLHANIKYLLENRGIAVLMFSEAAHLNYKRLRNQLRSMLSEQRSLISGVIKDGVREGTWKKEVEVEDAAILYMGILNIFSVALFLADEEPAVDKYCKRMFTLMTEVLT